jgi:hypothetical protein
LIKTKKMVIRYQRFCLLAISSLIVMQVFVFLSCTHDPVFISESDTICFEKQILPVLQNSCGISGCHDGAGEPEGFDATDYSSVIESVTPGDVHASNLYQAITDIWGENMMPPDRPLTLEQRTAIHIWIAQGAKNTTCSEPQPDTNGNSNNGNNHLPGDTICFVQDILPVFIANCATTGCHDATTQRDGYVLTSYANITDVQESIIPFDPPPPLTALSSVQIQKLRKWIEDGALNSNCPETTCDTTGVIGFSSRILPIFQNYCANCHNSTNPRGGVNLDNYTGVKTLADTEINGIPVLIGTIRKLNGFTPMPPDGSSVPDCDIRQIEIWIDQGKQNN